MELDTSKFLLKSFNFNTQVKKIKIFIKKVIKTLAIQNQRDIIKTVKEIKKTFTKKERSHTMAKTLKHIAVLKCKIVRS